MGIVAVDQLTKWWALRTLGRGGCSEPDACIDLVWTLRLHLIFNPGASFGTGASFGPIIGVVSFLMAGVMIWLAIQTSHRWNRLIYSAVAGGALGNGLDRLFRADDGFMSGRVVDFIDVQWWPIFNIADSAIVVAVVAAVGRSFLLPEAPPATEDRT